MENLSPTNIVIDLIKKSNEDIALFFLTGKRGDAIEISKDEVAVKGFVNRLIYEDNVMKIIFSYKKTENKTIQNFIICSKWWGEIKNSYFTIDGVARKADIVKYGFININDLKVFNYYGKTVAVNNTNKCVDINIEDFSSLVCYCQREFQTSPEWKVEEVISQEPPLVSISILMPYRDKYTNEVCHQVHSFVGESGKKAAKKFAKYVNENKKEFF